MPEPPKLGFIGLGQMGKWMALNLAKAGHDLTVCDPRPQPVAELEEAGALAATTPAQAAQGASVVLLSLPDSQVVDTVVWGPDGLAGALEPGAWLVDLGTSSYQSTLELAQRLGQQGVTLVDAPVSGMEARAREGALTIMAGGPPEAFARLKPLLAVMGDRILHMGPVGSGQLTKLVNQILFNISCAAIAEVLPMAAKLGLDPAQVVEVVTSGTGSSFAAQFFAPLALRGIFDQGYPLSHAYKDMISAAEISARNQIPLPLTAAATTTYQQALAEGHGHLGKGAMMLVFERLLGVEFRQKPE